MDDLWSPWGVGVGTVDFYRVLCGGSTLGDESEGPLVPTKEERLVKVFLVVQTLFRRLKYQVWSQSGWQDSWEVRVQRFLERLVRDHRESKRQTGRGDPILAVSSKKIKLIER